MIGGVLFLRFFRSRSRRRFDGCDSASKIWIADQSRAAPIRPDMIFDMGSMVKQFTAAAILLVKSEGKLSTSDSLRQFFPTAPADKASITLRLKLDRSWDP